MKVGKLGKPVAPLQKHNSTGSNVNHVKCIFNINNYKHCNTIEIRYSRSKTIEHIITLNPGVQLNPGQCQNN